MTIRKSHNNPQGKWDKSMRLVFSKVATLMATLAPDIPPQTPEILDGRMPVIMERIGDLLIRCTNINGKLVIQLYEFQSGNDPDIGRRIHGYIYAVWTKYGVIPEVVIIYIGEKPPTMQALYSYPENELNYKVAVKDFREYAPQCFLATQDPLTATAAVMAGYITEEERANITKEIVSLIVKKSRGKARQEALDVLLMFSEKRSFATQTFNIINTMVTYELTENSIFLPILENAVSEAEKKSLEIGEAKGKADAWAITVRNLKALNLQIDMIAKGVNMSIDELLQFCKQQQIAL